MEQDISQDSVKVSVFWSLNPNQEYLELLRILFSAQETPENVKTQFKIFEHEKGAITFQSLRKACHAMGEHLSDDQIRHMLSY